MAKLEKEIPNSESKVLLELEKISMGFGDLRVFDEFSHKILEGDSLVLVGPSGSGKTMFLKLLAGLIRPQSGRVLYRGREVSTLSGKDLKGFTGQLGMLFQKNALFDSLSVWDNLSFTLNKVRPEMPGSEKEDLIAHYLGEVGLSHVHSLFPGELSGGISSCAMACCTMRSTVASAAN